MHWLGREPQAAGCREEVAGIEIDKDGRQAAKL
jgi:hypothetical protein